MRHELCGITYAPVIENSEICMDEFAKICPLGLIIPLAGPWYVYASRFNISIFVIY